MYAAFPIVLFFIVAAVMVGLPVTFTLQSYYKNRGRRPVMCPENHQRAEVEVDRKFALQEALRGKEYPRVQTCSALAGKWRMWPGMSGAGRSHAGKSRSPVDQMV